MSPDDFNPTRARISQLMAEKNSPGHIAEAMQHLADHISETTQNGRRIIIGSDFDGVMARFVREPTKAIVDQGVKKAYLAYDALPNAQVIVLTGGTARRAANVSLANGIHFETYSDYGASHVSWHHGEPSILFHANAHKAAAILTEVKNETEQSLRAVLNRSDVFFTDGDAAAIGGGVLIEEKCGVFAFHPKGVGSNVHLPALLKTALQNAVAVVEQRHGLTLGMPPGNGSVEVKYDLGETKGTALERIVRDHDPGMLIYTGDDSGDEAAYDFLTRCTHQFHIPTLKAAVYNAPEPREGRDGTPVSVLEKVDVVFRNQQELAEFYGDSLRLAASQNIELEELHDAALLLPKTRVHAFAHIEF